MAVKKQFSTFSLFSCGIHSQTEGTIIANAEGRAKGDCEIL